MNRRPERRTAESTQDFVRRVHGRLPAGAPTLARSPRLGSASLHLGRLTGRVEFPVPWRSLIGAPIRRTRPAGDRPDLGLIKRVDLRDLVERLGPRGRPGTADAFDLGTRTTRDLDPFRAAAFLPPRLLRPVDVSVAVRAVRWGTMTDYPQQVRLVGGQLPSLGILRVLYVAPRSTGGGGLLSSAEAPHVLMSAAFSTLPDSLGELVGWPIELLNVARRADNPVQFYGFESTEYDPGSVDARPIFVGLSESMVDGAVDHFLIDHDPTTGNPFVRYIDGLPTGTRWSGAPIHHRTAPGLSFARVRRGLVYPRRPELLLAHVVGNDTRTSSDISLGFLSVHDDSTEFVPSDLARISPSASEFAYVWESIPVAWSERIGSWIVMATIADFDPRFYVAGQNGRLFRDATGDTLVSRWWPEQSETGHAGNDVVVNQSTGHVLFHTGHNTASGLVTRDQRFVNQWQGLYDPGTGQPPSGFPAGYPFGADGPRWSVGPCSPLEWEFQASGPSGLSVAVSRRVGRSGGDTAIVTRALFHGATTTPGRGVHRVVPIDGSRNAHIVVSGPPTSDRILIGVGFTGPAY